MSKNKINTKTIARIAAIQAIYQYQNNDSQVNISKVTENILNFYQNSDLTKDFDLNEKTPIKIKMSQSYFRELVQFTQDNLSSTNLLIADYLTEQWNIDKLPILLKSILQVAICELKYFPETPKKVIINEYTDIASDMINDQEIAFVNSILDKISKL
jgi:N utilization substance protein B